MAEEIKKEIEKLRKEKQRLNSELQKLETAYLNTAISTGAIIKQLDTLGKTASGFNKTSQRLNIGYFLSAIIQIETNIYKPGDPTETQRISIWTNEQNKFLRNYLYQIAGNLENGIE
jgi:hypothetical protein